MAQPQKIVVELSPEYRQILKGIARSLEVIAKNSKTPVPEPTQEAG